MGARLERGNAELGTFFFVLSGNNGMGGGRGEWVTCTILCT